MKANSLNVPKEAFELVGAIKRAAPRELHRLVDAGARRTSEKGATAHSFRGNGGARLCRHGKLDHACERQLSRGKLIVHFARQGLRIAIVALAFAHLDGDVARRLGYADV